MPNTCLKLHLLNQSLQSYLPYDILIFGHSELDFGFGFNIQLNSFQRRERPKVPLHKHYFSCCLVERLNFRNQCSSTFLKQQPMIFFPLSLRNYGCFLNMMTKFSSIYYIFFGDICCWVSNI